MWVIVTLSLIILIYVSDSSLTTLFSPLDLWLCSNPTYSTAGWWKQQSTQAAYGLPLNSIGPTCITNSNPWLWIVSALACQHGLVRVFSNGLPYLIFTIDLDFNSTLDISRLSLHDIHWITLIPAMYINLAIYLIIMSFIMSSHGQYCVRTFTDHNHNGSDYHSYHNGSTVMWHGNSGACSQACTWEHSHT